MLVSRTTLTALMLCALSLAPTVLADDRVGTTAGVAPVAGADVAVEAGARLQVPAGTELVFEMVDTVDSKANQRGDRFRLRLAEPLRIEGRLLVPAGAEAMGEVVHADRARAGGQAGELILAARTLDWDGRQLGLSGFRAGVGRDRSGAAIGVAVAAGVAGFLVRGGQIEVPAGSLISAKLREATELPVLPEPAPPAAPVEPATTETSTTIQGTTEE